MQNISNLLDSMRMEGISVSVVDGRLKVEPAGLLTDKIRSSIKDNRQELIAALLMGGVPGIDQALESDGSKLSCQILAKLNVQSAIQEAMSGRSDGQKKDSRNLGSKDSCLICGIPLDQDGGDCWHKAFHLKGDSPNLDYPKQPPKVGTASSSPEPEKAAAAPRLNDQAPGIQPHAPERINVVAVTWLRENRQGLKAAGWAASQLWRKNKSRGILFSPIWTRPFLRVTLLDHGAIEFEFVDAGRDCINVARPMPHGKLKSKRRIAS